MWRRFIFILAFLLFPARAHVVIAPPWSSTFNCPAQDQSTQSKPGGWLTCDGFAKSLDWTGGVISSLTGAANYPGGGGGLGLRRFVTSGHNQGSHGVWVGFSTPSKEFWARYYMRFEAGTVQGPGGSPFKIQYSNNNSCAEHPTNGGCYIGISMSDTRLTVAGNNYTGGGTTGGVTLAWGGSSSDGNWDCYEGHFKSNTVAGAADGTVEYWINGILVLSRTDVMYNSVKGDATWAGFQLPSNGDWAHVGTKFNDIDDVAISRTGRIGCLGAKPPLAAPSTLTVQ